MGAVVSSFGSKFMSYNNSILQNKHDENQRSRAVFDSNISLFHSGTPNGVR